LKGDKIKVQYIAYEGATYQAIADSDERFPDIIPIAASIPKNVAIAFSSKWKAELPPTNPFKTGLRQIKRHVLIVGGNPEHYRQIIKWLLDSVSTSKDLAPIPTRENNKYSYYHQLRESAVHIGVDELVEKIDEKMSAIEQKQIHTDDIREIWNSTSPNAEIRKTLVDHVAIRFWKNNLKPQEPYWRLRAEIPEFGAAVSDFIKVKHAELAAAKDKMFKEDQAKWKQGQAERERLQKQKWEEDRAAYNARVAASRKGRGGY